MTSSGFSIRQVTRHNELDACVALERSIWGADAEVDERASLVVASRFTGHVLGAFDGDTLIGMALSFYMASGDRMHSHRVGVLPGYQNRGVGLRLKLAQRDAALAQRVRIIEWTFDPLQARNAHFNLVRLGAVARTYLPNLYGLSASPLHAGLPTDRLLVEWDLAGPRVIAALQNRPPARHPETVRIELPPRAFRGDLALQAQLRQHLQERLAQGYAITGFATEADRDFYLLEIL
ncbi:MAG: GNAT family N-acetyltransferase [Acidobacteriaceae bacterium]